MYKGVNRMSPEIKNEELKQRNNLHFNLRHSLQFTVNTVHTVYDGTEIKKWKSTDYPCRIRKTFIPNLI